MLSWKEYTRAVDIWAVGCILAELLGRKPLFPGQDYMKQLHLIMNILGTPSKEESEYIASEKAKRYIRSLPKQTKTPWSKLFPKAPAAAIDLLEKMLQFCPEKRITVADALKHPYFRTLHDPSDEPTAKFQFDFSFEDDLTTTNIKETMQKIKLILEGATRTRKV